MVKMCVWECRQREKTFLEQKLEAIERSVSKFSALGVNRRERRESILIDRQVTRRACLISLSIHQVADRQGGLDQALSDRSAHNGTVLRAAGEDRQAGPQHSRCRGRGGSSGGRVRRAARAGEGLKCYSNKREMMSLKRVTFPGASYPLTIASSPMIRCCKRRRQRGCADPRS